MKRRVRDLLLLTESPGSWEGARREDAEDGLGAGVPIGRYARVRPLMRCEAEQSAKQGGTASIFCRP